MANKKVKTVPLSKDRFREARKLRKMSLAVLSEKPGINRTEKTLRRWIRQGEIPPDLLDAIGNTLNVDPKFISGELDRIVEKMEDDPSKLSALKAKFHASDFPYVNKQKRDLKPLQYVNDLLIDNDIAPEELEKLTTTELVQLYLELNKATRPIIYKYFKPHQSSLYNYSIPMPPEDEIKKG